MASPLLQREKALAALGNHEFDLLVVGGGITGAGIARDAALRGLSVALVEKQDFASGTSSKSSKLIHGGLRYLEQAELRLVFESVSERKRLMQLGRHLVRPLPFLVANYRGDRRSLVTLDLGVWIYDALCLFGAYKNHRTYGPKKTLALEPGLKQAGLNGGVLYYDCLTDDARLTLENALDAQALGAVVLNHVRAGKVLKNPSGKVVGLTVTDALTQASLEARARVVVNATGPWSDELRALAGDGPVLKPTKGVHLVVDQQRLPLTHALMMISPRDQRVVFCIPWGLGRTAVGTTDTFFDGSPDEVDPTAQDVEYLLETANWYFPDAKLSADDVLSTWSGLRPLLKPEEDGDGASALSREHMIYERPGFITIAGGKLTTYRRMAAEVVDRALSQLGQGVPSTTLARPLPGAEGITEADAQLDVLAQQLAQGRSEREGRYLAETYGVRATKVLARLTADPTAQAPLDPELPYLMAQVDEAVDTELACTLEDVLSRRVQVLLRARDQGLAIAPKVAERMAQQLGWTPERTAQELAQYRERVASSRKFRT